MKKMKMRGMRGMRIPTLSVAAAAFQPAFGNDVNNGSRLLNCIGLPPFHNLGDQSAEDAEGSFPGNGSAGGSQASSSNDSAPCGTNAGPTPDIMEQLWLKKLASKGVIPTSQDGLQNQLFGIVNNESASKTEQEFLEDVLDEDPPSEPKGTEAGRPQTVARLLAMMESDGLQKQQRRSSLPKILATGDDPALGGARPAGQRRRAPPRQRRSSSMTLDAGPRRLLRQRLLWQQGQAVGLHSSINLGGSNALAKELGSQDESGIGMTAERQMPRRRLSSSITFGAASPRIVLENDMTRAIPGSLGAVSPGRPHAAGPTDVDVGEIGNGLRRARPAGFNTGVGCGGLARELDIGDDEIYTMWTNT